MTDDRESINREKSGWSGKNSRLIGEIGFIEGVRVISTEKTKKLSKSVQKRLEAQKGKV